MSQVDDWADGYADSARDVNLYGPASANVPRSSVVSHQVRYRAPDTSDIPLAPGQNPEGSVYSNASSARMGQTKPASGYRAPAGGWDVNSSDTNLRFPNESGGRRYARSKTKASAKPARKRTQKPAASVKSSATAKSAATDYGSYKDQSDPLSQHILANGSSEQKPPVESVASGVRDVTDQSDIYRAIGRLSSPPSANDSQSEVRTAGGINPFESAESLAAWKQAKLRAFPLTYSDFSGLAPNAEVHRFREIALDPNSTVADVLTAENEAYKSAAVEKADTDNFGLIESLALPMPSVPAGYAIKAAAEGRRLYGPVAERLLAPKGPLTGGARTTLTSADEGLPVGYSMLRNPKIDTSPLAGQTSNLVAQLRAAGIPEDQIAASIARINAGAAGREAAAAGGQAAGREAAAAGEAAAGREAAAGGQAAGREAAAGGQTAGRVEHAPSSDISMASSDEIYSAVDKFMMENPGGASAVQDAIQYVTGKAPELERVAESLRLLSRDQLEQVFMDLRNIGKAFE